MSQIKLTPAIRFAGYTEDWEQRKYGDICKIVTKQTGFDYTATIKESLVMVETNDTLPYLQTKNFSGINVDYNTDYYIPKNIAIDFPKINLDEKCVLFSIVGASVGNIGFFPGIRHCFLSGAICVSKLKNADDSEYAYHFMTSENGQNQIRNCTKGGAQATVTIEDIRNFKIILPNSDERVKVASFLSTVDNLITLHQRKCEKLIYIKKALLEKMFPSNGDNVPRIRFRGYTEDWEQRKLGELCEIIGGGTPSTNVPEYWDGEINWFTPAEINDQIFVDSSSRKITELGYEKSSAKILPIGTVLFTSRAGIGKMAILSQESCTNQGFQSIVPTKEKLDSYFIYSRSRELKEYAETVGAGSTFIEVSGKQMAKMELKIPSIIQEQERIGFLFQKLDNLITLHQRKYEKLINIKKSLLKKMFV